MNSERPEDPREQMEVRITALLLGEASAFEEAELMEAIKNDPELEAFYQEMRGMIGIVEDTVQSEPMAKTETLDAKPVLDEKRRTQLKTLFKKTEETTIHLNSMRRARRLSRAQQFLAVAAALVILFIAIGMLLPSLSKAKSKASQVAFMAESKNLSRMESLRHGSERIVTDMSETTSDEHFVARYGLMDQAAKQTGQPQAESRLQLLDESQSSRAAAKIFLPNQADSRNDTAGDNRIYFRSNPAGSDLEAKAIRDSGVIDKERQLQELQLQQRTRSFAMNGNALLPAVQIEPESRGRSAGTELMIGEQLVRENAPRGGRTPLASEGFGVGGGYGGGNSGNAFGSTEALAAGQPQTEPASPFGRESIPDSDSYAFFSAAEPVADQTIATAISPRSNFDVDFVTDLDSDGAKKLGELEQSYGKSPTGPPTKFEVLSESLDSIGGNSGVNDFATTWQMQPSANVALAEADKPISLGIAFQPAEPVSTMQPPATPAPVQRQTAKAVEKKPQAKPGRPTVNLAMSESPAYGTTDAEIGRSQRGLSIAAGIAAEPANGPDDSLISGFIAESEVVSGAARELGSSVDAAVDESVRREADTLMMRQKVAASRGDNLEAAQLYQPSLDDGLVADNGDVSTQVQNAKLLLQMGRTDEAREMLFEAVKKDPSNKEGFYYLDVIQQKRGQVWSDVREYQDRGRVVDVNKAWAEPVIEAEQLTVEKHVGDPNWIGVLERSMSVEDKLKTITLDDVMYEGLPLAEVVKNLGEKSRQSDPDKTGVHFVIAPSVESDFAESQFMVNPQTGASIGVEGTIDIASSIVELPAAGNNLNLTDVLDAIVTNADPPLKYVIEDGAVVFRLDEETMAKRHAEKQVVAPPVQPPSLEPRPEIQTADNAFSTFSLNVSDVSFKLAQASLENGQLPDGTKLRSEEFINAFDYHDPAPLPGQKLAFNWERAKYPFAFDRELLRFSIQTAAAGRQADQPLNLVVLLDNSGSMERSDRVEITRQMLAVLADQLHPSDTISVISFARTPRLWVDGMAGGNTEELLNRVGRLNPEGGTNLEGALSLGYQIAAKHYNNYGNNRVILLTDGAANLGNVDPDALHTEVVKKRQSGIALDCFGVGWEGYNDILLETLSRNGDGRYGFINRPEDAGTEFADLLAGALQVAAADVKAQVEFNPERVTSYRQIGYLQHQLTKEQFRDNTVDAAEIGAAEAGNALYVAQIDENGTGPIGTMRVRYRVPATGAYQEKEWELPFVPNATKLAEASAALKLSASAAAFAEWLAQSPHAAEVTLGGIQNLMGNVPETFSPDTRPRELRQMIQSARSISGQ